MEWNFPQVLSSVPDVINICSFFIVAPVWFHLNKAIHSICFLIQLPPTLSFDYTNSFTSKPKLCTNILYICTSCIVFFFIFWLFASALILNFQVVMELTFTRCVFMLESENNVSHQIQAIYVRWKFLAVAFDL